MFKATFDSLYKFECPDWFRDAKFGIWSHWGPQSVPMYGDWYARNMYIEGSAQNLYHIRHYGHPSKFGYKDLCALWKAEAFEPEKLMDLYYKAGARYFVGQAMHHDHFFNFLSRHNRMNAAQIGPKKDIIGLWKAAADKYGLPFGLTEHLSASFSWWRVNKGADQHGPFAGVPYDGNDPAWRDFYFDNYEHVEPDMREARPWFTQNERFHAYWVAVMEELIDLYAPDLLYTDGSLPFGPHWHDGHTPPPLDERAYGPGLHIASRLYNASIARHGENRAIYTQKDRNPDVHAVGILDIEKSQLPGIAAEPWQTDTCVGNWFYDVRQTFKKPRHIIEMLVDIIAKQGCMLLNILQRPDGSLDDETRFILRELAAWFAVCAEGVYGTRPFRVPGEGDTRVQIQGFVEEAADWGPADFRFVQKGGVLYAFMMRAPQSRVAVIKSLGEGDRVRGVRLLGCGEVPFAQSFGVLTAQLPDTMPTPYVNCLAVDLA